MSIESRWTIGAMASKKASDSSPVSAADRLGQAGRGQRAGGDDHVPQSSGGRPSISPRTTAIIGCARAPRHRAEKPSRSTASAPPAGTWCASAARMISEPSARIS